MFQRIIVSMVLLSGIVIAVQAIGKDQNKQQFKLASDHSSVATQ
jgi:hypothetical protein